MVRMTLFAQSTETLVSDIRSRASCCLAFMGFWVISITPSNKNTGPSCAIALAIRCLGRRRSHPPGPSRCPVQGRELNSTILMSPFQGSIFCDVPKTSSSRPWSGKMVSAGVLSGAFELQSWVQYHIVPPGSVWPPELALLLSHTWDSSKAP